MVDYPLLCPFRGLAPPIRVRVEGSVVNVWQFGLSVKVAAIRPIVSPITRLAVKCAFTSRRHKMVGVE